jgi:hypothetical protein
MYNTKQEILIFTGTRFSNTLWEQRDSLVFSFFPSDNEDIEEECWRALLSSYLPEIFEGEFDFESLHLRQIWAYDSFVELDFAASDFEKDMYDTIDPYSFWKSLIYN